MRIDGVGRLDQVAESGVTIFAHGNIELGRILHQGQGLLHAVSAMPERAAISPPPGSWPSATQFAPLGLNLARGLGHVHRHADDAALTAMARVIDWRVHQTA